MDHGNRGASVRDGLGIGVAEVIGVGQIAATGTRWGILVLGLVNVVVGSWLLGVAWTRQARAFAALATVVLVASGALIGGSVVAMVHRAPTGPAASTGSPGGGGTTTATSGTFSPPGTPSTSPTPTSSIPVSQPGYAFLWHYSVVVDGNGVVFEQDGPKQSTISESHLRYESRPRVRDGWYTIASATLYYLPAGTEPGPAACADAAPRSAVYETASVGIGYCYVENPTVVYLKVTSINPEKTAVTLDAQAWSDNAR